MELSDLVVDEAVARRLLTAQFPRWADLPLAPAPNAGTDNAVFRLGSELALRLPRASWSVRMVEKELRWLPVLAPELPLSVPVPRAIGRPTPDYPCTWAVYNWLPGTGAAPSLIADPIAAARDLAAFLAALQHLDATGGPAPGGDNVYRGGRLGSRHDHSAVADHHIRARIAALRGLADTDKLTAAWDEAVSAPAWDGPPRWVQGDLHPDNLLVRDGRLCGVIDFGCLAAGDPACDLMVAWTLLPPPARAVFRDALGVDTATWTRGRGWGMAMALPSPDEFADPRTAERSRRRVDELIAG